MFFGANDAIAKEANNGQYVPLDDFKKNLQQILQHEAVKAHNPRLILITPPPVDEYQLEIADKAKGYDTSLQRRTAERTKSYADTAHEVGRELSVTVLDLWTAFMLKAGWKQGEPLLGSSKLPRSPVLSELLYDGMFTLMLTIAAVIDSWWSGLHLAPAGYRVLFDEMTKLIQATWPDQVPEKLPRPFPAWDDPDKSINLPP